MSLLGRSKTRFFFKESLKSAVFSVARMLLDLRRPLNLRNVQKILVIHAGSAGLGDTLLSSSVLKPLKEKFPDAKITFMVRKSAETLIKNNPLVSEIIVYDSEDNLKSPVLREFCPFLFVPSIFSKHFDLVVHLDHGTRFLLMSFLSGIRNRIGPDYEGRGFLLNSSAFFPAPNQRNKHEVEYYLDLLRSAGIPAKETENLIKIYPSGSDEKFAEELIRDSGFDKNSPFIGIHPFAMWHLRCWNAEKFAEVANELSLEYGAKVIIFGGARDLENMEKLRSLIKCDFVDAVGKTTLSQTAALMEKCKLVIANDSGVSHLASATSTTVLTLFGAANPVRWGPYGKRHKVIYKRLYCSPCDQNFLYDVSRCWSKTGKPECMEAISVSDVLEEARKIIGKAKKAVRQPKKKFR